VTHDGQRDGIRRERLDETTAIRYAAFRGCFSCARGLVKQEDTDSRMKKERIDIVVPDEVLAENDAKIRRLQAAHRLERPDRVPVLAGGNQFMNLAARDRTFGQYIASPEDNLREQILNRKWQIENIRDDAPITTESLTFRPDLGCLRGTEFPIEIVWQEDGPPKYSSAAVAGGR